MRDGYRCSVCGRQQWTYAIDEDNRPRCVDCQARPVNLAVYRRHRQLAPPMIRSLAPSADDTLLAFRPRHRQHATEQRLERSSRSEAPFQSRGNP